MAAIIETNTASYLMLCLSKANHSRRKKINVCGKLYLNKKIYLDIHQIKSFWLQQIFSFIPLDECELRNRT